MCLSWRPVLEPAPAYRCERSQPGGVPCVFPCGRRGSRPDRGRRDWSKAPEAQASVYGNRRRIRGRRGRRLMRQRGDRIERSFTHLYDTDGMRRTHLRGHTSILKRLLIHAGGFNLGLLMRTTCGVGTPRGLQGVAARVCLALFRILLAGLDLIAVHVVQDWSIPESRESDHVSSPSPLVATRRVGFTGS